MGVGDNVIVAAVDVLKPRHALLSSAAREKWT